MQRLLKLLQKGAPTIPFAPVTAIVGLSSNGSRWSSHLPLLSRISPSSEQGFSYGMYPRVHQKSMFFANAPVSAIHEVET